MTEGVNSYQVGGSHYAKAGDFQHWDFAVQALENRYLESVILKYVCRHPEKGRRVDLEKGRHYGVKLIEEIMAGRVFSPADFIGKEQLIKRFLAGYPSMGETEQEMVRAIAYWKSSDSIRFVVEALGTLINEYPPEPRPSVDQWALNIAREAARAGNCPRRQVGAVLLDLDGKILSVGFNHGVNYPCVDAPLHGMPYCPGHGQPSGTGLSLCEAVHAEVHAVLNYAGERSNIETAVVTVNPCVDCVKILIATGCRRIVFGGEYQGEAGKKLWTANNDLLSQFSSEREWIQLQ